MITIQGNEIVRIILVNKKLGVETKRPHILLEDKVCPKTYYHHNQVNIEMDETLAKIQVQNL